MVPTFLHYRIAEAGISKVVQNPLIHRLKVGGAAFETSFDANMSTHEKKLKIALVGCGQIADAHLQELKKIPVADAVAVCDLHADLAQQAAVRFQIPHAYTDMQRMLDEVQPDVVHVTTPVPAHRPLAIQAMQAGAHVYIEKPLTIDLAETEAILSAAEEYGVLICPGHDQLYDPIWLECRELCQQGVIGNVQHIDSMLGYSMQGPFGAPIVADSNHWVRRLPGGLFQNTISHPLYKITEFLTDQNPEVWATWFSRSTDIPFPTEMRVHLRGEQVTGSLLFTSTTKPIYRLIRILGTSGSLEVDLNAQVIRHDREKSLPGALEKLDVPFWQFREAARNLKRNIGKFLRSELHYFAGMRKLFEQFYTAILDNGPPPIAYAEIRRFSGLMDEIYDCCRDGDSPAKVSGHRSEAESRVMESSTY